MTTALKGNTTEAAVLAAFVESDYAVLLPFGEGHPYDLVVHLQAGFFMRVQCKTARLARGCVQFNSRTTDHGRGRLSYDGLADVFGVHFPPNGLVYLFPVRDAPVVTALRLDPPRNNQRLRVRFAGDYEFDQWTIDDLCRIVEGDAIRPGLLSVVA